MDDVDYATAREGHLAELIASRPVFSRAARLPLSRFCVDCKDEIPEARRRAVPSTTRCVDCQAEFEG